MSWIGLDLSSGNRKVEPGTLANLDRLVAILAPLSWLYPRPRHQGRSDHVVPLSPDAHFLRVHGGGEGDGRSAVWQARAEGDQQGILIFKCSKGRLIITIFTIIPPPEGGIRATRGLSLVECAVFAGVMRQVGRMEPHPFCAESHASAGTVVVPSGCRDSCACVVK